MSMTEFVKLRSLALFLLVASTSFVIACGDSDSTSPSSNEFGHYTLVSVNGQSLPFTLTGTARGTVVIQSATMDLSGATATSGGKPVYLAGVSGSASGQAQQLVTDNGTYVLAASTVTFSSSLAPGVQYVGAISGNTLNLTLPGLLFGTTGTIALVLRR